VAIIGGAFLIPGGVMAVVEWRRRRGEALAACYRREGQTR